MEYVNGIDVSKWQGAIDWGQVAAAGFRFAMIRCGVGHLFGSAPSQDGDPIEVFYVPNMLGAAANGVERSPYHWPHPIGDGAEQADRVFEYLLSVSVPEAPITLPIMADVEWKAGMVSQADAVRFLDQYLNRLYEHQQTLPGMAGKKIWLYSYGSWWKSNTGNYQGFTDICDLVVADTQFSPETRPNGPPLLGGFKEFVVWQYKVAPGVPGISGEADWDIMPIHVFAAMTAPTAKKEVPKMFRVHRDSGDTDSQYLMTHDGRMIHLDGRIAKLYDGTDDKGNYLCPLVPKNANDVDAALLYLASQAPELPAPADLAGEVAQGVKAGLANLALRFGA